MQRYSFKLIFALLLLCYLPNHLLAQINTQAVALMDASKKLDFEARTNYADAVIKAKKNRWAINYLNKNKSRVSLMGVDMYGQPIILPVLQILFMPSQ